LELDADDMAGLAVALGARVSAKAGPSEVLVSQTVKDLIAGSGIAFTDRGEHETASANACSKANGGMRAGDSTSQQDRSHARRGPKGEMEVRDGRCGRLPGLLGRGGLFH
jgi:class 3 adenylate cyclase